MTESVTIGVALLAGLLSFVSPCVLPLVPTYMTYLAGTAAVPTGEGGKGHGQTQLKRKQLYARAVFFVLGFSLIFIAFGVTASSIGTFLTLNSPLIRRIGGLIVIAFGLHLLGILRWDRLYQTRKLDYQPSGGSPLSALLLGASFGTGWTPCIGPVLASILVVASQSQNVMQGVTLLSAYSAGLAVPFLLVAVFLERAVKRLKRLGPYLPWIERISGGLLIIIGIMVYTNYFVVVNSWFAWPF